MLSNSLKIPVDATSRLLNMQSVVALQIVRCVVARHAAALFQGGDYSQSSSFVGADFQALAEKGREMRLGGPAFPMLYFTIFGKEQKDTSLTLPACKPAVNASY